ncbi:unnamed protein product, partial [Rhizoctonia solani]
MQTQLRFNILNLDSSLARDCDIGDLDAKVNGVISEELSYSCLYFATHLKLSAPTPTLVVYLRGFITHQLLAWLEILNLKHTVDLGVSMLSAIEAWLHENDISPDVVSLVHDAWKFVASLAVIPARSSTPHIYVSLLSTWRPDSSTFQSYGNLIRDIVAVDGVAIGYPSLYAYYNPKFLSTQNTSSTRRLAKTLSSNAPRSTPRGPTDRPVKSLIPSQAKSIRSVMMSADNISIISASGHLSISRWDRRTGKGISGPFHIRPACFGVVAFSPDAGRIATASSRYEVFVWDASTERLVAGPFYGHQNWVTAIAFSPDGTRIVSGARDQAVLVWDICAPSAPVQSLGGHHHLVRVWDLRDENSIPQLLQGHTSCVRSVDVSSDGALIVSGADDRTIRIWDMSTFQMIYGPFEGHSDYILSVKFSPNGQQVVSGSQDCTVRVWNVSTGDAIAGSFTAHTSRVNAVAFSTDGTQVVSGSDDGTIRVWNVQSQPDAHIERIPADSRAGDSDVTEIWKLNPDGWVVDKDENSLIWIPPLAHDAIRRPAPDHILIPRFDLPISSLLEGKAWKELCRRQEGKSIRCAKGAGLLFQAPRTFLNDERFGLFLGRIYPWLALNQEPLAI